MLLGFFAKFSAIVKSIPQGVLGGVTIILYTLIAITGVRIWVVNKVDFNGIWYNQSVMQRPNASI